MRSRFVSTGEPVYYSSLNTSLSLIALLCKSLISKLIKRKVVNPARAAHGCPGCPWRHTCAGVSEPGDCLLRWSIMHLRLPNARISVFVCVLLSVFHAVRSHLIFHPTMTETRIVWWLSAIGVYRKKRACNSCIFLFSSLSESLSLELYFYLPFLSPPLTISLSFQLH